VFIYAYHRAFALEEHLQSISVLLDQICATKKPRDTRGRFRDARFTGSDSIAAQGKASLLWQISG